ncbi:MAG: PEP/pyruvate-binding domain-containing protein [bacterium]
MSFGFLRPPGAREDGAGVSVRHSYESLRSLLNRNTLLLERMAELEADLRFSLPESPHVHGRIRRLADEVLLLVEDLNVLARDRFKDAYRAYARIRSVLARDLETLAAGRKARPLVLPLEGASQAPPDLIGEKAAHLARILGPYPELVPPGFVVTTAAYWQLLHAGELLPALLPIFKELDVIRDPDLLRGRLEEVRRAIRTAPWPARIREEILEQAARRRAPQGWAVRSSAAGEDGRYSFAGQFTSLLHVPETELPSAYRRVVQSRFEERAVAYRKALDLEEIETPMAVLFLAMVPARSAGVVYTRDPGSRDADRMIVQAVWGLAEGLVTGRMEADQYVLTRSDPLRVLEERIVPKPRGIGPAPQGGTREEAIPPERALAPTLGRRELGRIREIARSLEALFRAPLDIEWAMEPSGAIRVVQARPLVFEGVGVAVSAERSDAAKPLLEGGTTIQAGRAAGPAVCAGAGRLPGKVPERAILVLPAATPEISTLLPFLAGCIAEMGNPAGHAATLLREWRIPSLFGLPGALRLLENGMPIALDATNRRVHEGCPWPELQAEKPEPRAAAAKPSAAPGPFGEPVFALHLSDPESARFRPEGCASLHDLIRLVHEKAVEALFELGDAQAGSRMRGGKRLASEIPLPLVVLDLGGAIEPEAEKQKTVQAAQIRSVPFQALWRGVTDPRVSWAGRQQVSMRGFGSVLVSAMAGGGAGRRMGERNYLLVAPDYLNLNARLAYHFAMVDALVGESPDNNFVNFRFRGGGARADRRELRARFLFEVLLRSGFAADRRGDLVTAWLRRYPRSRSEEALALLGRLMSCSRQLDMLIGHLRAAHEYAERFLAGDYAAFR